MPKFRASTLTNVWYLARKEHSEHDQSFGSREGLEDETGIDHHRLAAIEAGTQNPTPEEARLISLACEREDLQYYYCSECCPLGRNLPKITEESAECLAIQVAISCGKLVSEREMLLNIMADGLVDEAEERAFRKIVDDMHELIGRFKNMEIQVERYRSEHGKKRRC